MISTRIGKYSILRWLGGGAFGDVYLAEDSILGEKFALKVSRLSPKEVQVLKDEARVLARLYHPCIVRFYNADFIDGRLVMVMEYVEGGSLRHLMDKDPPGVEKAVEIACRVLEGLEYAHKQGVVHRDIKPENILLGPQGEVKLTDFGLARFLKKGTISASMAGTPVYLPPEGWTGKFTERSDIYSLGVVLYEMLTGVQPFTGDSLEEVRKAIFQGRAAPVTVINSSVPPSLAQVVGKAMHVNPQERFASAEEFRDALVDVGAISAHRVRKAVLVETSVKEEGLQLTEGQRRVVECEHRRILLKGCAGSGKTTCLVHRICYLVEKKELEPSSMLVATFTRKAAADVKERVEKILRREVHEMLIDTVHGIGLRILRKYGWLVGIPEDFEVTPLDDEYLKKLDIKQKGKRLKRLVREAEKLKTRLMRADEVNRWSLGSDYRMNVARIFHMMNRLATEGLLTYEDLLYFPCRIMHRHPEVAEELRANFKAVFVDEIQDFTCSQYELIKLLTAEDACLFITGDPYQHIYSWRGASTQFMDRVVEDFPGVVEFSLQTSFRLPAKVLQVAQNLMSRHEQAGLVATAAKNEGEVELFRASSDTEEAEFVARRIHELVRSGDVSYSGVCVLFRSHFYSRNFEEAFSRSGVPYTLVGMTAFYEREEVTRVVGILRALVSGNVEEYLKGLAWLTGSRRVIQGLSEFEFPDDMKQNAPPRYRRFIEYGAEIMRSPHQFAPGDVLQVLLEDTGCLKKLKRRGSAQAAGQVENLEELLRAGREFKGTIQEFIDHIGLMEDLELARWNTNAVRLMTVHSSKGLEFPVVFITGLAEGIFPLESSSISQRDMEEERRLLFVALTRALQRVILSFPSRRGYQVLRPSRFLFDMVLK